MAKLTVEQELQAATGVKPKTKEKRQEYLKRLHNAVSELDDNGWKAITTPAQNWANEATKAFDADDDIPDFDTAAAPAKGKAAKADEETDGDANEGDTGDETDGDADAEEADTAEESEDTVDTKTKTATKKPTTKTVAKADPAPKKKTAAPAAKPAKPTKRGSGGVQAVMGHVLKHPDDKVEDIIAALKKDGIVVTPSTVSSARGFFKLVVRFLGEKKLLTKKLFEKD